MLSYTLEERAFGAQELENRAHIATSLFYRLTETLSFMTHKINQFGIQTQPHDLISIIISYFTTLHMKWKLCQLLSLRFSVFSNKFNRPKYFKTIHRIPF